MTAVTGGRQPAVSMAAQAPLVSVDSYLAGILSAIRPLPPRALSLAEADGAVLAEDVRACCPLPCFDNSAMDGYAVRACDVASAAPGAPVTLPVDAEVAAGDVQPRQLKAGTCMRIMTGALMPAGADAVVRVEWTDGGTERVTIGRPVSAGDAVRRTGSDARTGELLLTAGARLGPAQCPGPGPSAADDLVRRQ
jgi:molybdopterin molybdotransferase